MSLHRPTPTPTPRPKQAVRRMLFAVALMWVGSLSSGCGLVRGVEIGAGGAAGLSGGPSGFAPSLSVNLLLLGGPGWGGGLGASALMHDGDTERTLIAGLNVNFLHALDESVIWHTSGLLGYSQLRTPTLKDDSFGVSAYTGIAYELLDNLAISVGPEVHLGFNPYTSLGVQARIVWYPDGGGCMCGSH